MKERVIESTDAVNLSDGDLQAVLQWFAYMAGDVSEVPEQDVLLAARLARCARERGIELPPWLGLSG